MENILSTTSHLKPILWGISLFLGIVIVILVLLRVDTYMKHQGINDCAEISRYEQSLPGDIKVSYPVQDIYQDCLKKKGI